MKPYLEQNSLPGMDDLGQRVPHRTIATVTPREGQGIFMYINEEEAIVGYLE